MQLGKSRRLLAVVVLIPITSLILDTLVDSSLILHSILGGSYFLVVGISMALTTAVHERGHLLKLEELGYIADNFVAYRIGNVSFHIQNVERMTPKESYQVAAAPFIQPDQYVAEFASLLLLFVINWYSPFPLNIVLALFTFLSILLFLASVCVYVVIRTRRYTGLCVGFARTVTSRGDVDDITMWNEILNKEEE